MQTHPDDSEKPTLETLLRFKRHECPRAEFWEGFDCELERRMAREFVAQADRRRTARRLWLKFSVGFSTAASVAFALILMDAPQTADAESAPSQPAVVADTPAPAPILEGAALRETSFVALKADARPAQTALTTADSARDEYTKVWANRSLPEYAFADQGNVRFVAGTTPEHTTLPGVATYISRAY